MRATIGMHIGSLERKKKKKWRREMKIPRNAAPQNNNKLTREKRIYGDWRGPWFLRFKCPQLSEVARRFDMPARGCWSLYEFKRFKELAHWHTRTFQSFSPRSENKSRLALDCDAVADRVSFFSARSIIPSSYSIAMYGPAPEPLVIAKSSFKCYRSG